MQHHLYLDDTYTTEIDTTVARSDADEAGTRWVALSRNIFHPKGGGQPADEGTVNGLSARPRFLAEDRSWVVLDLNDEAAEKIPSQGDEVTASIDLELRRLHAALHTAGHLIHAVGEQRGWQWAGNNHFPGQARVEFEAPAELSNGVLDHDRLLAELQSEIDEAIARDIEVSARMLEDGFRTVSIGTMQTAPCGGTHVRSLGFLMDLRATRIKVRKGKLSVVYDAKHR